MLQQSLEHTPRYGYLKTVTYLQNHHYTMFSNDRLVIFSREILQQLQTIRNFTSDIVAVATSQKSGSIVVFCEKEYIGYQPTVTNTNTVRWTKVFQKNCSNPIRDAFFSQNGCSSLQLTIWEVEYRKNKILDQIEQNEIISIREIFNVEMADPIQNVKFTPDVRFICTLHTNEQRELRIWDFEAIKEFPSEGDIAQLPHTVLQHQDVILSYKLRETSRISPSPIPTPISIVTQTAQNILTIWQEQPFQLPGNGQNNELRKIVFFKLHTLYLQNITSFCFIYGYNRPHSYPWLGQFIPPDSIGIQDLEEPSVDYILIHMEDEIQIIKLELLKNYSLQTTVSVVHQYTNSALMKSIKKMVYSNQIFENDIEKLEIIGFDRLWNLTKIVINLSDQTDFRVHTCDKFTFQSIQFFSYDQYNDTVCIKNNLNLLSFFKSTNIRIINQQFEVRQMDDYQTWKIDIDQKKCNLFQKVFFIISQINLKDQNMFHYKDILLFFSQSLEEILLLQLSKKILIARPIKIANFIQKLDKEQFRFDSINLICCQSLENEFHQFNFILLRNNYLMGLRITLSDAIFKDNNNNNNNSNKENVKIDFSAKVTLNFKYNKISIDVSKRDENNFSFFAVENKIFRYVEVIDYKLFERVKISKQYMIAQVGALKEFPQIFYIISPQNEIDFHNAQGDFILRFKLTSFLVKIDQSLYDPASLCMKIHALSADAFLLSVENYIIVVQLIFDKQAQAYRYQILQSIEDGREQYYFIRLSKYSMPALYEFYDMQNGNILIKTGRGIRVLNNSLESHLISPESDDRIPQTINMRLLSLTARTSFHDPSFLMELLQNGKMQLVNYLYHIMILNLHYHGTLGDRFSIPLSVIDEIFEEVQKGQFQGIPKWFQIGERESLADGKQILGKDRRQEIVVCEGQDNLSEMKKLLEISQDDELRQFICLSDQKIRQLQNVIEFSIYIMENKRSLDFYAEMFMYHVHVFRNQPRQGKKGISMCTKEIVWAMNSIQKDTLWQECVEKNNQQGSEHMLWTILRRYCTVLWMDNLEVFKNKLEKIALAQYKQSGDPFQAMLYYVMLGKKNVVAMLFKKEMVLKLEYKNTFEFLQKDFNDQRWKSAASKNAYALISKKRYTDACSFFLIGGHLADAVNVIAVYLEDIQLALLCARLHEYQKKDQPVTKKLIHDYFIKTGEIMNDIWLLHIGYHLLGQYVDSVNALYRQPQKFNENIEYDALGKQVCLSWPKSFEPQLSCFHPSATMLAQKLEDSILVKREIQNSIELANKANKPKDDDIFSSFYDEPSPVDTQEQQQVVEIKTIKKRIIVLRQQSIEYYFNTQQPILGILAYKSLSGNIQDEQLDQQSQKQEINYLNGLNTLQIQVYLLDSILIKEHNQKYARFLRHIQEFTQFLQIDQAQIFEICSSMFRNLRSPSRLLSFELGLTNKIDRQLASKRVEAQIRELIYFTQEMQHLIYIVCFSFSMNAQTKDYYSTLIQSIWEIDFSLKNLVDSKHFHELIDANRVLLSQVNNIKFLTHFTAMILSLEMELWSHAQDLLKKLEHFCHENFQKQNLKCAYEPLSENFFTDTLKTMRTSFNMAKTKSRKALRCRDLLADVFPEDKYEKQAQLADQLKQAIKENHDDEQFQNISPIKQAGSTSNRNVYAELVLYNILKTSMVKYFLSVSKNFFSTKSKDKFNLHNISFTNIFKLAEQYQYNRYYQIVNSLKAVKDYQVEYAILEDIGNISKNENGYRDSRYFTELPKIFNPQDFCHLCTKVHVDVCVDLLLIQLCKQSFKNPRSIYDEKNIVAFRNKLFNHPVEVYRTKDTVRSFAMNNAPGCGHEGVVLQSRQLRRINLLQNLLNRNRTQDGNGLIDEETMLSDDTSIVKDEDILNRSLVIRLTCSLIAENDKYADKNCVLSKNSTNHRNQFFDINKKNVDKNQQPDYSHYTRLESHPNLPIYAGGCKGAVDLLSFKSPQIIQEFQTNNKEQVEQIRFNNNGDMILGVDSGSNAYVWKIHTGIKSKLPIFSLSSKTKPVTDMCFVNEGSVVATVYNSTNRPQMSVFDLLLPYNKNVICSEQFFGNNILFSSIKNTLLICNQKKGLVNFYDIRKNQIYQNLEIPYCEIKEIAMNHYQNKIVCVCNDGNLKIYSIDSLEQTTDIKLFRSDKKIPHITKLSITSNLALVSSSDGTISIAYLNV